jgi:hypothetical protein
MMLPSVLFQEHARTIGGEAQLLACCVSFVKVG